MPERIEDQGQVRDLVAQKRVEQRYLDYKAQLPGDKDGERADFLADVASFANSNGGTLLFGMEAERDASGKATGAPLSASGLADFNFDQVRLRLEALVRDGIAPRVSNLDFRAIAGFERGPVLAVHVPRSFHSPHMVTLGGRSRFYARGDSGKFPLDVQQIRAAFLGTADISASTRAFRLDRLASVRAGGTPMPLKAGGTLLALHSVPLAPDPSAISLDDEDALNRLLQPMRASGWNRRRNFDGFVTWAPDRAVEGATRSYVQIFRNGAVEAVLDDVLSTDAIPIIAVESIVIDMYERIKSAYRALGIEPPVAIMLSLIGAAGRRFAVDGGWFSDGYPLDRDDLLIPDVEDSGFQEPSDVALRPAFDMLWQAAGFARSLGYDPQGRHRYLAR